MSVADVWFRVAAWNLPCAFERGPCHSWRCRPLHCSDKKRTPAPRSDKSRGVYHTSSPCSGTLWGRGTFFWSWELEFSFWRTEDVTESLQNTRLKSINVFVSKPFLQINSTFKCCWYICVESLDRHFFTFVSVTDTDVHVTRETVVFWWGFKQS